MLPPRAYTFIGLNVVRILSIIALLLVFASSVVVMVHDIQAVVKFLAASRENAALEAAGSANATITEMLKDDYIYESTVPNQAAGAFWAVLNRLLIIGQTIVLLFSEFGWPAKFFDRFFPVLGQEFGLGPLGLIQCLIGAAILSHHVDTFALVSAFFLFSLGCLNIIIGLIWRAKARDKRSVTSWRESKKDVLPKNFKDIKPMAWSVSPSMSHRKMASPPPSFKSLEDYRPIFHSQAMQRSVDRGHAFQQSLDEKAAIAAIYDTEAGPNRMGYGFGRQGEKAAAMRGFLLTKPVETLPRYLPKTTPQSTGESWDSNPFRQGRST